MKIARLSERKSGVIALMYEKICTKCNIVG